MERKRIIINFKNTAEEIELYNKLKKHSSISGYIKDILKGVINNTTSDNKVINSDDDICEDINDIIGG